MVLRMIRIASKLFLLEDVSCVNISYSKIFDFFDLDKFYY